MKIINTGVHDIDFEDIDQSKINLSNKIIENIFPLLEDIKSSKLEESETLKFELIRKTKRIKKEKNELKNILIKYQKQKKIKKLLERISKIVSRGLTNNNGSYRHETIVLLKVIDTLSEDQLNYHLSETLKTINKRFSILL